MTCAILKLLSLDPIPRKPWLSVRSLSLGQSWRRCTKIVIGRSAAMLQICASHSGTYAEKFTGTRRIPPDPVFFKATAPPHVNSDSVPCFAPPTGTISLFPSSSLRPHGVPCSAPPTISLLTQSSFKLGPCTATRRLLCAAHWHNLSISPFLFSLPLVLGPPCRKVFWQIAFFAFLIVCKVRALLLPTLALPTNHTQS